MRSDLTTAATVGLLIAAAAAPSSAADAPPLFEGLGNHGRKVMTASPAVQKYFDQGLAFLFAFNHDEAIRSFQHAAALDPDCAMAHWGVALACGPHYNKPDLPADRAKEAWASLRRARARAFSPPGPSPAASFDSNSIRAARRSAGSSSSIRSHRRSAASCSPRRPYA